jgi:hypothetical protein
MLLRQNHQISLRRKQTRGNGIRGLPVEVGVTGEKAFYLGTILLGLKRTGRIN